MDYKYYAILTVLEAEKINFEEVKETSMETLRRSKDGLLTFVEFYCDDIVKLLQSLNVIKVVIYAELIQILETEEWKIESIS